MNQASRIAAILLATILASAAQAFTEPEELEVAQLVRYVLDTTQLPGRLHLNAVVGGKVEYDDEIRHPQDPPGPTVVDCQATQLLGLRYRVKRPKRNKYKREAFDITIKWTHTDVASNNEALQQPDRYRFNKSQFRLFPVATLELFDEIRVDGILTLEISTESRVLLRNSFELSGCSNSDSTPPVGGPSGLTPARP